MGKTLPVVAGECLLKLSEVSIEMNGVKIAIS